MSQIYREQAGRTRPLSKQWRTVGFVALVDRVVHCEIGHVFGARRWRNGEIDVQSGEVESSDIQPMQGSAKRGALVLSSKNCVIARHQACALSPDQLLLDAGKSRLLAPPAPSRCGNHPRTRLHPR